jgi:hypothetical protein
MKHYIPCRKKYIATGYLDSCHLEVDFLMEELVSCQNELSACKEKSSAFERINHELDDIVYN